MIARCIFILSLALTGCKEFPPTGSYTPPESVDINSIDTAELTSPEHIAEGERYDFWIAVMDEFVTQDDNWTFNLDWNGFIASTQFDYPEVYSHYTAGTSATDDTVVIDALLSGLPIASAVALEQYEIYQALIASGAHLWTTNNTYWWWRQSCFGGGSEDWMIGVMQNSVTAASTLGGLLGAPSWLIRAYLSAMVSSAQSCNSSRDYFCISYSYSGFMWVSC